jgi:hypothetical protein
MTMIPFNQCPTSKHPDISKLSQDIPTRPESLTAQNIPIQIKLPSQAA